MTPATTAHAPRYLRFERRNDDTTGLLAAWRGLRERPWLLLGGALLGAALGVLHVQLRDTTYTASALLLVGNEQARILSIEEKPDAADQALSTANYFNQVEYLRSYALGVGVIKSLQLWTHAEFDARAGQGLIARARGWLRPSAGATPDTPEARAAAIWPAFAGRLWIHPVTETRLVEVSFRAHDAALAAQVANGVVRAYLDAAHTTRLMLAGDRQSVLDRQAEALLARLEDSSKRLQGFRERSGIVSLGAPARPRAAASAPLAPPAFGQSTTPDAEFTAQTLLARRINELNGRIAQARMKRTMAENAWQQARAAASTDFSDLPATMTSPGLADAQLDVDAAHIKLAELSERYGGEHPLMQAARGELQAAQARRKDAAANSLAALRKEADSAAATEAVLNRELASAQGSAQQLNRSEISLNDYAREMRSDRELYQANRAEAKALGALRELRADPARVIQPASAPFRPDGQAAWIFVVSGLLAGLLLGALGAIVRERFQLSTRNAAEAERLFALPVLSEVPETAPQRATQLPRMCLEQPASAFSESIRTLRSAFLLSDIDLPSRSLLLTSSVAGEGKTTLSANLAFSLAETGRCLLVDADLRRAGLSAGLDMPREIFGLTDYLEHPADPARFIHRYPNSALDVMPAGRIVGNPLELLQSEHLGLLLRALATRYDYIIVDSPPLAPASDALSIASLCTRTLYVLRAGRTVAPLTHRALLQLRRAGANVLGIAFNAAETDTADGATPDARHRYWAGRQSPQYGFLAPFGRPRGRRDSST